MIMQIFNFITLNVSFKCKYFTPLAKIILLTNIFIIYKKVYYIIV